MAQSRKSQPKPRSRKSVIKAHKRIDNNLKLLKYFELELEKK